MYNWLLTVLMPLKKWRLLPKCILSCPTIIEIKKKNKKHLFRTFISKCGVQQALKGKSITHLGSCTKVMWQECTLIWKMHGFSFFLYYIHSNKVILRKLMPWQFQDKMTCHSYWPSFMVPESQIPYVAYDHFPSRFWLLVISMCPVSNRLSVAIL